ncbi:MAG: Bug family tripartite tricarboxylate transporter substrate binding protein [Beijerinckiaceae bacterium]
MLVSLSGAALGQSYPARPITLLVPAPPGGGTDVFARALGEIVEGALKQKVVIENRGGGGGTLGVTQLVNARPDGYTLAFIWNSPITTSPHSLPVSYTPASYRAVMSIGYSSYVLCAQPDFAASNAKEMIAKLKEPGTRFTYGNDGVGGTMQLAAERIFNASGVKVRAVPFSGAGETAKNFLGGHVDLYGGSLPPILAHAKAGKAKCLLLTSAAKNAALPDADGLEAIGLADKQTVLWWGLIAPASTPEDIVNTVQKAFMDAAATDKFKEVMERQGATLEIKDGATTGALIKTELEALGEVARAAGIEKKAP